MRVFVTGATGFVGSVVVQELLGHGHQVLGLARSDAAAAALSAAGAEAHRGDLQDLESLRSGAAAADGVIHCGFIHDFANFKAVCETDRVAVETLGAVLAGSQRPLVVTSGTALVSPGSLAAEDTKSKLTPDDFPRAATELAVDALVQRGVRASVVRLSPSVHGDGDHGFVPLLINMALEKGASAYVGEGRNRWSAVHRLDAAQLYRLALEQGSAGARYHGVAEQEIAFRDIAAIIGKRLNLPVVGKSAEEAAGHFGWFAHFAALDCPASSQRTRELLGWQPKQAGLLADLEQGRYFEG
jgi:nucleoside-diphosphate-sugar epimerase